VEGFANHLERSLSKQPPLSPGLLGTSEKMSREAFSDSRPLPQIVRTSFRADDFANLIERSLLKQPPLSTRLPGTSKKMLL
jgi:hypothetical protein